MFSWDFWTKVYATIVAAAFLGVVGALARKFVTVRERRLLPSKVSIVFEDSDQFRRYESVASESGPKLTRTVYLVGAINNTRATLHGVQCFVDSVEEYQGPETARRPLQPLGAAKYAERIDVPPSTNSRPSVYFQLVEDFTRTKLAEDGWSWLCVQFGSAQLPFIAHVNISLEGDGFTKKARFSVSRRKRRAEELDGTYTDVQLTALTVRRLG